MVHPKTSSCHLWPIYSCTSKSSDDSEPFESYLAVLSMNLAFAISLFGKEIWVTLVILSFCNGLVYCYECTGIAINFPNSSQGVIFALVELTGSLFNFVQIPITEQVKGTWIYNSRSVSKLNLDYASVLYPDQRFQELCPIRIFRTWNITRDVDYGAIHFVDCIWQITDIC